MEGGIWIALKTAFGSLCFIGVLHLLWVFARDKCTTPKVKYFIDSHDDPDVYFYRQSPTKYQDESHQQYQDESHQQYQDESHQQYQDESHQQYQDESHQQYQDDVDDSLSEFVRQTVNTRYAACE